VKSGAQCGSAATLPPSQIESSSSARPSRDISSTRPGRTKRRYQPISSAIGIVIATVNVPQGLAASALTTTSASTARMMNMIISTPIIAITPAAGPISVRTISPSERASRRTERKRIMKSCTAPAKITPTMIHSVPGR
jgi:hypothetical protein